MNPQELRDRLGEAADALNALIGLLDELAAAAENAETEADLVAALAGLDGATRLVTLAVRREAVPA